MKAFLDCVWMSERNSAEVTELVNESWIYE